MWSLNGPPQISRSEVWTQMPSSFCQPRRTDWGDANRGGAWLGSFLEGPSFDRAGNLYVTDIPHGRIFRIDAAGQWQLVAEYDGWPNGTAFHRDGSLWIADYRRGLLRLDPASGTIETILGHRNSEAFRGINDLTFDLAGNCYFTDQGQSGLQDPSGKVYRLRVDGGLDCVISGIPSPNGLAIDHQAGALHVAVTRANQLWRGPLMPDGSVTKVAAFQTFYGASGPDGMALDAAGGVAMAHASLGGIFVLDRHGAVLCFIRNAQGGVVTNVAFEPGSKRLIATEAETGSILQATLDTHAGALFSHEP